MVIDQKGEIICTLKYLAAHIYILCKQIAISGSVTIFVGDLDDEITDSELRQAFDPFGEIL